jgi:hypothetical protein
MRWSEFLEKTFSARLDQEVVIQHGDYGDLKSSVAGVEFDADRVIIVMEETE